MAPQHFAQPMKMCSTSTLGRWQEVADAEDSDSDEEGQKKRQENRKQIRQTLSAVLQSDQLAALVGLGASAEVGGPTTADLWKAVRDKHTEEFKEVQKKVGDNTATRSAGDIERLLSKCQALMRVPVNPDETIGAFVADAEKIIADACRGFLESADLAAHEHLLRILVRRPEGKPRTRVFTTNYDLCIERAASNSGLICADGFGHESVPVFDGMNFDIDFVRRRVESRGSEFIDGVFQLSKLHGSVDWAIQGNQVVRREAPQEPLIIYPRSDKFELSYRQPFLEMVSQFQSALRQSSLGLLVIGFSFADSHLSEMIFSAIKRNLSLRVFVTTLDCERHCDAHGNGNYRQRLGLLQQLIEQGDSRITLLDASFSDFVRLVPDLGTETEEDRIRLVLKRLIT